MDLEEFNAREIWKNKGGCLYKLGMNQLADWYIRISEVVESSHEPIILALNQIVSITSADGRAYYDRGICFKNMSKYEEAQNSFLEAVNRGIADSKIWANIGICCNRLKQFNDALPCFLKAIKLDYKNEKAWFEYGINLEGLGRYQEAIYSYDKTSEIDQSGLHMDHLDVLRYIEAQHHKGLCLAALHDYDNAILAYQKLINYCSFPEVWFDKANAEEQSGRKEDAMFSYDMFLKEVDKWGKYQLIPDDKLNYARTRLSASRL
jgi:tetratricopeptide (TPR) repeat protein